MTAPTPRKAEAGSVVVPREPTEAMIKAIAHADWTGKNDLSWADGWRIMWDAYYPSAAPPAVGEGS